MIEFIKASEKPKEEEELLIWGRACLDDKNRFHFGKYVALNGRCTYMSSLGEEVIALKYMYLETLKSILNDPLI